MDKWKCVFCGKDFLLRHNVGLTNSITEKDICVDCYNRGVQ